MSDKQMSLYIYGDPVNGFSFVGPFDTYENAINYSETQTHTLNWWIAALNAPDERPYRI